jgi:hypothetical protein
MRAEAVSTNIASCYARSRLTLETREETAVTTVQVVRQVERDEQTRRGGVDRLRVTRVVEVLSTGVSLDVVRVKVTPSQLDVEPELGARRAVEDVLVVVEERRAGDLPLVGREEEDVRGGRVHLVRLSRVDRLLLNRLDLEGLELLVEDLTQVHDDGLMDL